MRKKLPSKQLYPHKLLCGLTNEQFDALLAYSRKYQRPMAEVVRDLVDTIKSEAKS